MAPDVVAVAVGGYSAYFLGRDGNEVVGLLIDRLRTLFLSYFCLIVPIINSLLVIVIV